MVPRTSSCSCAIWPQRRACDSTPVCSTLRRRTPPPHPVATMRSSTPCGGSLTVSAYILIQTEVGKAAQVAPEVASIAGVAAAEDVTGPYAVDRKADAEGTRWTVRV